jgi:alginate O-acetyltransferase complex protein AlgI
MFLPIVCTAYFFARKDLQNYILLVASIVFYAWGEPSYLAIMILTILVNYIGANYISRSRNGAHRKWLLALTILADLSVLFYFKYFNFMAENINALFHADIDFIKVIMPIGISFYTFQALSYVIDVYRGDTPAQRDIYKLALYICLFPQLIAGPIVKYHDVAEQIENRDVTFDKVAYGIKRFIVGLAKKMLLANTLGAVADKIFALPVEQFDCFTAWVGAVAYSFQLFYDFSGYSDMAIGLGRMLGFEFPENFRYP